MFLQSENHKNYYRYCYSTSDISEIAEIIDRENRNRWATQWPHYSPASLQRRHSLPELSDSYPSTPSSTRSSLTSTLSSEANTLRNEHTKFEPKSIKTDESQVAKLSEPDAGNKKGRVIERKKLKSWGTITNLNEQSNKSVLRNTNSNNKRVKIKANETKIKKSHTFSKERLYIWPKTRSVSLNYPRTSPSAIHHSELSAPCIRDQTAKEWVLAHFVHAQPSTSSHAAYSHRTTKVSKKQDESLTTQSRYQTYLSTKTAKTRHAPRTRQLEHKLPDLPTERIHDIDHQHVTQDSNKDKEITTSCPKKNQGSLPTTSDQPNSFQDIELTFYRISHSHKAILRVKQTNSDSDNSSTIGNLTFQKYNEFEGQLKSPIHNKCLAVETESDLICCCYENTHNENTLNKNIQQELQHIYETIEDDPTDIKDYDGSPKSEIKPQQFQQQCFEQQKETFVPSNYLELTTTKQQYSKNSEKTNLNIEHTLQLPPKKQSLLTNQTKGTHPKTEGQKTKLREAQQHTVQAQIHRPPQRIPQQKHQTTSSFSKTEELNIGSVNVQSVEVNPEEREEHQYQLPYSTFKKNLNFNSPITPKDNYFRRQTFNRPILLKSPSEELPDLKQSSHRNFAHRSKNQSGNYYRKRRMENMGALEDHERKVIIEFCHLLEKSKQLFNGLRELPQYGHKQWHSYFGRTFDVYTKLWKFQQQHRAVLDSKYRLKRWQIGEIASKIGQLYYHFYLRTSETAYLNEAYSFYYAIRGRSYYTKASKEDKCELMVKKLRYYARFIVVCLLLKKIKLVRELIKELDRQIIEYGNTYDPDDQVEWTDVVDEVKAFIQAESVVSVIHPDSYSVILSHRLSLLTTIPIERTSQMNLSLQEVLIVGSTSQQVKFSELTMDMFRMLQTLEREPTGEIQHMYDDSPRQRFNLTPSALNNKGYNLEPGAPHSDNPHKYLLFKPSPSQILVYLASGCNDLPPNGALLLYISADGQMVQPSKHPEDGYDIGGLITTSKNDLCRDGSKEKGSQAKNRELQCFHPGDLYPFTRRPLFVIIDSENSYVFQNMPRHFGQPLVVLMSPIEVPSSMHASSSDRRQQGSLFTLFLHSPLTAFCHCSDIHNISLVQWDRAQAFVDTFLAEASQIVTRHRIDAMYLSFMSDDFLRLLILRFIFCEVVLRMHRSFRARTHLTRSSPPIPDDLLEHPALTHIVMDLATHLQVRANFHDPSASGPPPVKE